MSRTQPYAQSSTAVTNRTLPVGHRGHGLSIHRLYTIAGQDPLEQIEYELRTSTIKNPDGQVVREIKDVEVPTSWSQVATDIIAQKYFRKAGVPQYNPDGQQIFSPDGQPVLGSEHSAKQVIRRMAGTWRWWGEWHGYFSTAADAQAYQD